MRKPKLLDLFCGAGGCSEGYRRAGFEPYGIDNDPKPLRHYPFPYICMDALEAMDKLLAGEGLTFSNGETLYLDDFAAFHASPPCQGYSEATPIEYKKKHPRLIPEVRHYLRCTKKPFVIENVPSARYDMQEPVRLNGTIFGLPTYRNRYFETHPDFIPLLMPSDTHIKLPVVIRGHTRRATGRYEYPADECRIAAGIDWMTKEELNQAIPPAYTEYIGKYLMEAVK